MNDEFYELVESAIDAAFEKNLFLFKAYHYFKYNKVKRREVQEFIDSTTAKNVALIISDLEAYIKGGSDSYHKQLKEAYGHLGKPKARKISKYLHDILKDAKQYEIDRRPGRKKRSK
jgi:hypothetical protein|tara:strand:+ start:3814 stop:4164 length:351 start_codon:yes stop_codon:yes gene_type:complete